MWMCERLSRALICRAAQSGSAEVDILLSALLSTRDMGTLFCGALIFEFLESFV